MNNELVKRAKHHRKRQKGLPALSTLKTNAGNVEHNVMMFNKMNSPIDGPNTNPISGPMGGDVSAPAVSGGMGEAFVDSNNVQYGVHQFSTSSIIFRGTEEECIKYIDERKELWDDAEVYMMTPDDPHYIKTEVESLTEELSFNELKELIKELFSYLRSSRDTQYIVDDIYPSSSNQSTFIIPIYNGDWKHEHLYIDEVVSNWLRRKGYEVKLWKSGVENSDSDTFSADHYFKIIGETEPVKYDGPDPQNVANHLGTRVISDGVIYNPKFIDLNEDIQPDDMFDINNGEVTLYYPEVTITVQGPKRDVDDWDEWEVSTDAEYVVDTSDIIDYLYTIVTPEELPADNATDEEIEEFWNDNFEKLLRKYQKNVLDKYESDAAMSAEENYTESYDDDFDMSTRSLF